MRKHLLSLLLIIIPCSFYVNSSAQTTQNVIKFRNGNVIKGIVIERMTSDSIHFTTNDGSYWSFSMNDVITIQQETIGEVETPTTQSIAPTYSISSTPNTEVQQSYDDGIRYSYKNPVGPAIASFFIPGLGQLINGQYLDGCLFIINDILWSSLTYTSFLYEQYTLGVICVIVNTGMWIYSIVDAAQYAIKFNKEHGLALMHINPDTPVYMNFNAELLNKPDMKVSNDFSSISYGVKLTIPLNQN
ncbi:MAG: hypothetical protein R3Y59_07960 [bacterium]